MKTMLRRRTALRLLAYTWAAPNTVVGLLGGLVVLCFGGRAQWVDGVAEFHGGLLGRACAALPFTRNFGAATLGHVVLAVGAAELGWLRAHETAHVRQYERWGVFFLPAYALSSVWEAVNGRNGYHHNWFERQAYAEVRSHQPVA